VKMPVMAVNNENQPESSGGIDLVTDAIGG
jgi:hypothetical protein